MPPRKAATKAAAKTPRKAKTKAVAKTKALISSNDVEDESKNGSKITDHFKVKFRTSTCIYSCLVSCDSDKRWS